jgi:hypothetical protein
MVLYFVDVACVFLQHAFSNGRLLHNVGGLAICLGVGYVSTVCLI